MVKRLFVLLAACAACATVADLEVNRPGPGNDAGPPSDSDDGGVSEDGAAVLPLDAGSDATRTADSEPPVFACDCDAGSACCVRSSSEPACGAAEACTEPGSLVVGCIRSTTDGRDCCWKPDAGGALASFGAGCATGTAACRTDADCAGQGDKCTMLTCKGVLLGVCAAAAPSWFVCPP